MAPLLSLSCGESVGHFLLIATVVGDSTVSILGRVGCDLVAPSNLPSEVGTSPLGAVAEEASGG